MLRIFYKTRVVRRELEHYIADFYATVTVPLASANIFQWQLQRDLALKSLRRARVQVKYVVHLQV